MSERGDSPIGPDEVEVFYARQRRQIVARLDGAAPAARPARRSGRGWAWMGLAAAAALVLAFVALQRPAGQGLPGEGGDTGGPTTNLRELVVEPSDGLTALPAGLRVFGAWTDDDVEEEALAGDSSEARLDSLAWLLEPEAGPAQPLPAFLEPFGTWEAQEAESGDTT